MIDCGEGTQMQIAKYHIRAFRIEHIFISHLHGDHYFGLVGLITSFNLNKRERPLTVYCPEGLEEIVRLQLKHSKTELKFDLKFVVITPENGKVIFENNDFSVSTLEMNHRIPCAGFVFREKIMGRKIIGEAIEKYEAPHAFIPELRKGTDFVKPDGTVIKNDWLTTAPPKQRSYAFCTDTSYLESIIPFIKNVDLLYHEATFTSDLQERANETFHSTAKEAATIALKAEAKRLLLGHFSARYIELDHLLAEAREVFPNTDLANEGLVFTVEQE